MSQQPCDSAQQRPRSERKRPRAFCSVVPFLSIPCEFAPLRRPSTAGRSCALTGRTFFLSFPFPPSISGIAPRPPANSRFARTNRILYIYIVRCPAQQKIRSFPRSHAHLATPSQTLGSASVTPLRAKFAARCVRIAAAKRAQRPVRAVRPCRSLSLGARLAPPAAWQLRGYAAPAWLPRQQFSARLRAARTFPPPPE